MAPPSIPTMSKQSTPKTMSSRLMTMKFMQRGAAIASAASDVGSPTTPRTDDDEGSASKRRKLSRTSAPNTPNTPATPLYDQKALQAAIEEEEKKTKAAIEKRAAELGDAHWVLPNVSASSKNGWHKSLNIVQVGFSQIDTPVNLAENPDSPEETSLPAAARFRQFNMKKSKTHEQQSDESDDSSDDSSDDDSEDASSPAPKQESDRGRRNSTSEEARKRARTSLSTQRDENRRKSQELARERRKREINLNKLTSISSSGPSQQSPKLTCRVCGKPGHKAYQCPKKGQ